MLFGPLNLLLNCLTTAVSLSILGGGIYSVWGWYEGAVTGIGFLVGGIAMIVYSVFGRYVMLLLLPGKKTGPSVRSMPEPVVHRLARPNGSELYVEELGLKDAPVIVLTHGLSFDSSSWNYQKQALASRFRILAWDMPGFGKSRGRTGVPYTIGMLAEDLRAVVELAGSGPVALAGHSMGGMVTLTYCRLYPDDLGTRVAGLMLAQTTYTNPVKTAKFHGLLTALQVPVITPLCYLMIVLSPLVWLANLQNYLSGMAHLSTHLTGYAGMETPEQLDFAARFSIASSPATSARALLAMFNYDASDVLSSISIPTLVITGDHDIVTLPTAGETIHKSIQGSQRTEIVGSGHLGLLEQHEQYNRTIESWASVCLAELPGNRRSA